MIKTLLISPYQGLAEIAKNYRNYDPDLQLDIKIGNLEEGVRIAKQAEAEGYDMIISRGGTASLIEEQVKLPVVDIKISGYDMLRIFTLLKGTQGKAALVGFPNISRGASTICSILDMDVKTITIESGAEVADLLTELKSNHYSVVIGDVVTVQQAERIGLQGILITSGKEAVMESFEEAKRLYHLLQRVQAQAAVSSEVIESFPQPMTIVDLDGQLLLNNESFRQELDEEILHTTDFQDLVGQMKSDHTDMWKKISYHEKNYHIYGYSLNLEEKKLNFIFQQERLKADDGFEILTDLSYIPISGDSQIAQNIRENIPLYAEMDSPLWIEGEQGTGRMMFACNLHFEAFGHRAPLLSFDLSKITISELEHLFSSGIRQIPKEGTIVLHHIHQISREDQIRLKKMIASLVPDFKVMIISHEKIADLVKEGQVAHEIYYTMPNAIIYLPPLRNRKEDIKNLVQAFITQNHMKYGYETVGLREEAIQPLLTYTWPGNIDELKQMVEKLVLTSPHSYIERADVEKVMEAFEAEDSYTPEDFVKVEGTLKDMEIKIINKVMQQEQHNQSRVAKRLGMNRTTLWRKLNS
ncbi:PrpR N-terminal domain-containing protein [Halobacillus rhizosphaerae]|uniref:sigma-54-dependent transcriptional regulator n=1 Tax=Halobacillus rhizosphaerae TaxID=3064889 RepID=UPI00398B33C5